LDLGSWIRKKLIPDPGVKKAPDPGSATLEVQHNTLKINHRKVNRGIVEIPTINTN
jgi:hypothetical protein